MTKAFSLKLIIASLVFSLVFAFSLTPALAAHDDEHMEDSSRIEQLETLLGLLQQLVALLQDKVAMQSDEHMEDDSMSSSDMDLSGIHIMADGSVMLGDGTVLDDASVNDEGMIVLGDGTEVEPVYDMRADSEYEPNTMWIEIHDGMTHVHYVDGDGELDTFFVNSDVSDEAAVIDEVVEETGLDEADVTDMLDFDEIVDHGEDSDDDDHEHDDHS